MNVTETAQKFPWGRLAVALFITALLRLPSLDMPLDRDEGEYATLALALIQGWGIPYRDFLEQKPPLAILAYLAAFLTGGESAGAVRAFAMYWQWLSCAALFTLTLRLTQQANAALLAAVLFACLSVSVFTQGLSANTELFITLPMLGAMAVLSYGREKRHWIVAGAFMGIAGLAKQTALPAVFLLPLLMRGHWQQRLQQAGYCAAGAALPWMACLAAFAVVGASADFWRCVITYNFLYAGQGLKDQLMHLGAAIFTLGKEDWALWIALFMAARASIQKKIPGARMAWIWLGAMFLGATMSGRYYPHYFQPLAAPVALLVAIGAAFSLKRWPVMLLLSFFGLSFAMKNAPLWTAHDGNARSLRLYGLPNFALAPRIAEAVQARSSEDSRILVWGAEAEIYFLSRRRPATRFLFHYPFTGEAPSWPGAEDEMLQAMENPSTEVVVLMAALNRADPFQRKLGALLQKNYELRVDLAPDTLIGLRKK